MFGNEKRKGLNYQLQPVLIQPKIQETPSSKVTVKKVPAKQFTALKI